MSLRVSFCLAHTCITLYIFILFMFITQAASPHRWNNDGGDEEGLRHFQRWEMRVSGLPTNLRVTSAVKGQSRPREIPSVGTS